MATIATFGGGPARFPGGLREVAPRTWAWLQPNGGLGESNAGLIVGTGESLLVDTLWDEPLTRRMLDAMTPVLGDALLRRALITHPDGRRPHRPRARRRPLAHRVRRRRARSRRRSRLRR